MKTKENFEAQQSEPAPRAGSARDREMGRADEPLGDLGRGRETWTPPAGEQGISNRSDDGDVEPAEAGRHGRIEDDDLQEGISAGFEDDLDDEGDGFEEEDDDEPRR